jgi:hypothetical protein
MQLASSSTKIGGESEIVLTFLFSWDQQVLYKLFFALLRVVDRWYMVRRPNLEVEYR